MTPSQIGWEVCRNISFQVLPQTHLRVMEAVVPKVWGAVPLQGGGSGMDELKKQKTKPVTQKLFHCKDGL